MCLKNVSLVAIVVAVFSGFLVVSYCVTRFGNSGRVCPKLFAEQAGFSVKRPLGNVTRPILVKQLFINSGQQFIKRLSLRKPGNLFPDLFIDRFTDTQAHLLLRADCVARQRVPPLPLVFGDSVKGLHHFFVCSVFAAFLIFSCLHRRHNQRHAALRLRPWRPLVVGISSRSFPSWGRKSAVFQEDYTVLCSCGLEVSTLSLV